MSAGDLVGRRDQRGRFVSQRARSRADAPDSERVGAQPAAPEPAAPVEGESAGARATDPATRRAPVAAGGPRPLDPLLGERLAALPDAPTAPAQPENEQPTPDPEPDTPTLSSSGAGPSAWLRPALWVAAGSLALVTVTLRVAGRGAPASAGPAYSVGLTGLEGGVDEIHF